MRRQLQMEAIKCGERQADLGRETAALSPTLISTEEPLSV